MDQYKGKNEKIDLLVKTNVRKSLDWCIKHKIQYNYFSANSNIFIKNENSGMT
jgi:hypothetical protein